MALYHSGEFLKYQTILKSPFAHPTVAFRTKIVPVEFNLYDEKLPVLEDYGLWFDLILN